MVTPRKKPPMMSRAYRSHSTVQLPVSLNPDKLPPIPFFQYKTTDFLYNLRECSPEREFGEKSFKEQILKAWNGAKNKNVFNYNLNCMYKLLDGDFDLSVQLNTERGTLRRKPMRFRSIKEPFNHLRWNFTKLLPDEILYKMRCLDKPYSEDVLDTTHIMAVNASPLERGHTLVIPSMNKCLPQVLNSTAIRLATDLMLLNEDENFHMLFNSLLGQASVNHLHLHGILWPYDSDLINRKFEKLYENVYIIQRPAWFISAIAFQLPSQEHFDSFVNNITKCVQFLTRENIAHNMYFSRAQPIRTDGDLKQEDKERNLPQLVTAYLFPRTSLAGAKPPMNFNPAALELAGCLTAYTWRFFDSVTELSALRVIEEEAVIDESLFSKLVLELELKFSGRKDWNESVPDLQQPLGESLSTNELEELVDSFQAVTSPSPLLRHHTSLTIEERNRRRSLRDSF
uniref:GDP-D-glucose phosphorylase 1 n=1 Tax=Panagrolaimus sp. ES5 TaxID=591445 RepID=A0AC34FLI5_9BILA